jgi:hypothetical protein
VIHTPTPKTHVDLFLDEFGDDWPLKKVKFGHDDGGRVIEIYCEEPIAQDLRDAIPYRYGADRLWTVVISVPEGYLEE